MIGTRVKRVARNKAWSLGLLLAAPLAVMLLAAKPAHAETFTVNSTGDDGDRAPSGVCNTAPFPVGTEPECTLRAAIEEANSTTGTDTINFNIGGSGVKTISLSTSLPTITDPVTIDGYTEPGAGENTLAVGDNADIRIRLDGAPTRGIPRGLIITADNCVVRGLSITNFPGQAIDLATADNTKIEGNFVGITPAGEDAGNGDGISIRSAGSPPDGAVGKVVGGTTPAARNIISGNGPSSNFSATGVGISDIGTTGNKVMGNYIGTTKSGTGNMGNTGRGLFIGNGTTGNIIGDDNPADGLTNAANVIAFNGLWGVDVSGQTSTGNTILRNSIFSNARTGINLGGVPNDPGDADIGPNNLQNFPVLSSAVTSGGKTTVKGRLNSTPNTTFTLQFFSSPAADPSGFGEGQKYLGQSTVTTDSNGDARFSFTTATPLGGGQVVSATATDSVTADTSEFSKVAAVNTAPTITNVRPAPGSRTRDRTPLIAATVRDAQTDLAKTNIRLFVDGKKKSTFSYNRSTDRLTYTSGRLSFGRHTVRIVATDGVLSTTRIWRFQVIQRR
jgi:CSLREA domain-containing protein